eukprot:1791182-Rhodomonas_salina.1
MDCVGLRFRTAKKSSFLLIVVLSLSIRLSRPVLTRGCGLYQEGNLKAYGTETPVDYMSHYNLVDIPIHFMAGVADVRSRMLASSHASTLPYAPTGRGTDLGMLLPFVAKRQADPGQGLFQALQNPPQVSQTRTQNSASETDFKKKKGWRRDQIQKAHRTGTVCTDAAG